MDKDYRLKAIISIESGRAGVRFWSDYNPFVRLWGTARIYIDNVQQGEMACTLFLVDDQITPDIADSFAITIEDLSYGAWSGLEGLTGELPIHY
jgi:hypothetical protein